MRFIDIVSKRDERVIATLNVDAYPFGLPSQFQLDNGNFVCITDWSYLSLRENPEVTGRAQEYVQSLKMFKVVNGDYREYIYSDVLNELVLIG